MSSEENILHPEKRETRENKHQVDFSSQRKIVAREKFFAYCRSFVVRVVAREKMVASWVEKNSFGCSL